MSTPDAEFRRQRLLGGRGGPPLLLDAGMGTRLIARGLDLGRDDPALWSIDRPEEVAAIHETDVDAGADVLTSNTFGANASWLDRFGRAGDMTRVNRSAAELARRVGGPERPVLGCIGPTAAGDSAVAQAEALAEGGVDALLLETNSSEEPLGPLLRRLRDAIGLPMLVTYALVRDVEPIPPMGLEPGEGGPIAIGWNCIPPERAVALPGLLREPNALPLILRPSGGRPWEGAIPALIASGVRFFGGCCGTTESDIAALRHALGSRAPGRCSGASGRSVVNRWADPDQEGAGARGVWQGGRH